MTTSRRDSKLTSPTTPTTVRAIIFVVVALPFLYLTGMAIYIDPNGTGNGWMWAMSGMIYLAVVSAAYALYCLISAILNGE